MGGRTTLLAMAMRRRDASKGQLVHSALAVSDNLERRGWGILFLLRVEENNVSDVVWLVEIGIRLSHVQVFPCSSLLQMV
jgi:hypothetical protein